MKKAYVIPVVIAVVGVLSFVGVVIWVVASVVFPGPNEDSLRARIEKVDGVVEARVSVSHQGTPWSTNIWGSVLCDVAPEDIPSVVADVLLVVADPGLRNDAYVEIFFYGGNQFGPTLKETNPLFGEGDLDSLGLSAVGDGAWLTGPSDSGGIGANGAGLKEWARGYLPDRATDIRDTRFDAYIQWMLKPISDRGAFEA